MLHGIGESQPTWAAEIVARWLRRRLNVARASGKSAAPRVARIRPFAHRNLERSLPESERRRSSLSICCLVLDASDGAVTGDTPPKRDAIMRPSSRASTPTAKTRVAPTLRMRSARSDLIRPWRTGRWLQSCGAGTSCRCTPTRALCGRWRAVRRPGRDSCSATNPGDSSAATLTAHIGVQCTGHRRRCAIARLRTTPDLKPSCWATQPTGSVREGRFTEC